MYFPFLLVCIYASDPNDAFLQPQITVVLHGQSQKHYQGSVLINAYSEQIVDMDESVAEYEYLDAYTYGLDVDPSDIRVSKGPWALYPPEKFEFPKGDASQYKVLNYVGDGTFSQVARAQFNKETVIVKEIVEKYAYTAVHELEILLALKGAENVVQIIDAYMNNSCPVLVFEELKKAQTFDYKTYYRNLTLNEIKHYFKQIFIGIAAAHSRTVMHLDIKPANIIFHKKEIQILDWGVSEFYYPLKQYRTKVGTRHYRAPEQLIHWKYYDYAVDIWAIGTIMAAALYEKSTLFDGRNNDHQLYLVVQQLGSVDFFKFCEKYDIIVDLPLARKLQNHPKQEFAISNLADATAVDLLKKILTYDPRERWTANQILQHEFFHE